MRKSASTPSFHTAAKFQNPIEKGMVRNKSTPKLNALPQMFIESPLTTQDIQHIEETAFYVPIQQVISCRSTQTFPLSLLDNDSIKDEMGMATCLLTPSITETEEPIQPNNIIRRIVSLDVMYRRRLLYYKMLTNKKS